MVKGCSLLVLGVALVWPLLRLTQEIPIVVVVVDENTTHDDTDTFYNIVDLKAPAATGPVMKLLSYVVCRSPISSFVLRHLLNDNGIHHIRQLAATKFSGLPATHYPVYRVKVSPEMNRMADLHKKLLGTGIHMKTVNSNYHGIMDYHNVYLTGKATPSEVMEEFILGAQKLEHLHIWSSFRPDDIRRQAMESNQRWKEGKPLSVFDGVPVAIKDMSSVAGHRMCRGSNVAYCVEKDKDDLPARRLREAGAIIVGMTVMTEAGTTPLGYTVGFDGPFNPYKLEHYPGGSSSGSAVAVASGLVPMAVGFDGGGSIRVPASMSGVHGLAATYGRIMHEDSAGSTMIKPGPLAATMLDVALSHLLLSQIEDGSFHSKIIGEGSIPPPNLESVVDDNGMVLFDKENPDLKGVRLGIYWDHFKHTDPEVYEACLASVRHMESLGAELVNITIPHLREIHLSHGIRILAEFGLEWESEFFDPDYDLETNTEISIALGRTVTAAEILAAGKLRTYAMKKFSEDFFREQKLDAIVSPMLGDKVPRPRNGYRGYGETDMKTVYKAMRFVPLANLLGLPGLTVPIGYEKETNLPIGFQFLGHAWSEHKLIRLGIHLEQSTTRRRPPAENFYDSLEKFL